MKLANAKFYEEQIKEKLWEIWYDEKYQFYFNGGWRNDFSLNEPKEYQRRGFAVLNNKEELIGYIEYYIDNELGIACWFSAINFSDDIFTFGLALRQVVSDCFLKFGLQIVEWNVICGNPIEKSYDKLCKKFGGTIVSLKHRRAKDMAGNLHDEKTYEILRENFLKSIKE